MEEPAFSLHFDFDRDCVGRTLLSDAFDLALDFGLDCHPEEAESHAKRVTPDEGPMQLGGWQDSAHLLPRVRGIGLAWASPHRRRLRKAGPAPTRDSLFSVDH